MQEKYIKQKEKQFAPKFCPYIKKGHYSLLIYIYKFKIEIVLLAELNYVCDCFNFNTYLFFNFFFIRCWNKIMFPIMPDSKYLITWDLFILPVIMFVCWLYTYEVSLYHYIFISLYLYIFISLYLYIIISLYLIPELGRKVA